MNPFFPRAGRDFGLLHKFPIHFRVTSHPKEVTDGGTYIDTCILIAVGSRLFALKHIGPVVYREGTNVFPLRVGDPSVVVDRDPSIVTNGDSGAAVNLPEPWDN